MIKGISFVLGLSMVCGAIACSGEDPQAQSAATDGTAGASGTADPATSDLIQRRRRTGTGGTVASTGGTSAISTGGTVASTGGTVASTGGTVASTGGTVASTGGTSSSSTGTGGTTSTAIACPPAAPSTATIYYACDCAAGADKDCVAGNDSNTGTSASAPWRSFEKARSQFASLRAGDRIEFCKGGRFTSTTTGKWVNPSCKAGTPCVVATYKAPWSSGDEGRPVIHSPTGQNGIDFTDGGNADHEEGYMFAGLELEGEKTDVGYFFYNDIDSVTVCDTNVHDFGIGVQLDTSNTANAGADMINSDITITDSYFSNNGDQGFLGGNRNAIIQNNHFKNNGFNRAIFNHNIYIATNDGNGNNIIVRNNDLYQSAMINGKCAGTDLVGHGLLNGLLIERNTVHEDIGTVDDGCWGIGIEPGYAISESFQNVTIRGNTVINVGNQSIGVASCQNCVIEDNVVVNQQNINDVAIAAPGGSEDSIDTKTDQITIRNNSIALDVGVGIGLTTEGSRHTVTNNAVYSSAGSTNHLACFSLSLPTNAYLEIDHNDCYLNGGKGEWALGQGQLATWSSKTGFDAHSSTANPGFKSVVAPYDLGITSSSPLINTGDTSCATVDITGKTRTAPSDIGAFEL